MKISKLQYISQGLTAKEQKRNIRTALDQGIDWVQLRWKNAMDKEITNLAETIKIHCENYQASLIINDFVSVAKAVDTCGIHLGLNDEKITTARAILGKNKIIGGTANTLEDVIQRINEGCDYIGLGPYRFTTTKEKLSPILDLEGYKNIFTQLKEQQIEIPKIIAIGGIEFNDLQAIKETEIYGVALSGLITKQPELVQTIKNILQ